MERRLTRTVTQPEERPVMRQRPTAPLMEQEQPRPKQVRRRPLKEVLGEPRPGLLLAQPVVEIAPPPVRPLTPLNKIRRGSVVRARTLRSPHIPPRFPQPFAHPQTLAIFPSDFCPLMQKSDGKYTFTHR